jgi:hypothetical protein
MLNSRSSIRQAPSLLLEPVALRYPSQSLVRIDIELKAGEITLQV